MATLTKFPVTMPDGTEYCVKIAYDYDGDYVVRVYMERQRRLFGLFRFKRVKHSVVYAHVLNGYVEAAQYVVSKHHNEVISEQRKLYEFTEWDGKIT